MGKTIKSVIMHSPKNKIFVVRKVSGREKMEGWGKEGGTENENCRKPREMRKP